MKLAIREVIRAEVTPKLQALHTSQKGLWQGLVQHKKDLEAVAEDTRIMRQWMVTDVLSKLRA